MQLRPITAVADSSTGVNLKDESVHCTGEAQVNGAFLTPCICLLQHIATYLRACIHEDIVMANILVHCFCLSAAFSWALPKAEVLLQQESQATHPVTVMLMSLIPNKMIHWYALHTPCLPQTQDALKM